MPGVPVQTGGRSVAGAAALLAVTVLGGACAAPATDRTATARVRPTSVTTSAAATSAAGSTSGATVAAAPARGPLSGHVVGIDPGHNGRNWAYPAYLQRQVWNGREYEDCDTTGTATDAGYPEPRFTWRVARDLRRDLVALGATVVMTRHSNTGHGPCIDTRAKILNRGGSDVAVDIHGDGAAAGGRGFAILEPVRDRQNRHVIRSSARFGRYLRHAVLSHTAMPTSSYDGRDGITHRNDLAGLNLAREPKVLIECGNMRNAHDARLLTSKRFQHRIARAMTAAIRRFLLSG